MSSESKNYATYYNAIMEVVRVTPIVSYHPNYAIDGLIALVKDNTKDCLYELR